jgi:hypothetical protein
VLAEFFILTEKGYINPRADAEIAEYHDFCARQKANGIKGGRPKKTHGLPTANPSLTQPEPKITLNTNHKPLNSIGALPAESPTPSSKKGTRLPKDWQPSDDLMAWSKAMRPDLNLALTLDSFRDFWAAKAGSGGVKLDWDATWRNWVRKETQKPVDKAPVRVNVTEKAVETPEQKAKRKLEEVEAWKKHMRDLGEDV